MSNKKDHKAPKSSVKNEEKKLIGKHPFESMSQIQNRYGKGRQQSGSDGTNQDSRGSNH